MNSASFTTHGASLLFSSSKMSFLANSSWRSQSKHDLSLSIQRSNSLKSQVMAKANASPAKGHSTDEVIMVDPLEAKRLAAKQMQEIRVREKLEVRKMQSNMDILAEFLHETPQWWEPCALGLPFALFMLAGFLH